MAKNTNQVHINAKIFSLKILMGNTHIPSISCIVPEAPVLLNVHLATLQNQKEKNVAKVKFRKIDVFKNLWKN